MKHILGVRRATKFSPNHTGNDSAIFSLTVKELEKKYGYKVRQITEEEFFHTEEVEEDGIFSMIRHKENVLKLQQLEKSGKKVINSGYGLENCYRANLTNKLIDNNIPYPKSTIIPTNTNDYSFFDIFEEKNVWIKRGDFHTVHKEDVSFCNSLEFCSSLLKEYALRDIPNAVISEHLEGDLVKFYAVEDTGFFHSFYPLDENHIKFNELKAPEKTKEYPFDVEELKSIAKKSAKALNIHIYGGDAIISAKGEITIIDFNDWPSFAPCRDKASYHIAECIHNFMEE